MSDLPPSPEALLGLAVEAGEAAAALLLDGLHRQRTLVATKSSTTDMVTEMDRRSEALIVDHLLRTRPDDGILGEEGTERPSTSGVTWVIDPLDGTTNYLYGYPGFSVSIAAVGGGGTLAAAVVDPIHRETWTATAGGGAHCNGDPLAGPGHPPLGATLLATGFSYDPARRARQGQVLAAVLPQVRDIRRGGGAAIDLCWVAGGRVDAFYERGLAPWDLAAGALIAAEAGARVADLDGTPAGGEGVLAAHPERFAELASCLLAAGAPQA
ncbi:MAG: inositol monophosphatase [Acidimicrobiales bacterium]|nr:inositol monophosphatase [Acidimicrobiales bacterium]